jgi:hypothetical protein
VTIHVRYIGTDDSRWNLRDFSYAGEVFLTDAGVQALGNPDLSIFKRETIRDGVTTTGHRVIPRNVKLPVMIGRDLSSGQWLDLEERWWAANEPGSYGTLEVAVDDRPARSLRMMFVDDGGVNYVTDPSAEGSSVVVCSYEAHDPFWTDVPVERFYSNVSRRESFFGGSRRFTWTGATDFSTSQLHRLDTLIASNHARNPRFVTTAGTVETYQGPRPGVADVTVRGAKAWQDGSDTPGAPAALVIRWPGPPGFGTDPLGTSVFGGTAA